MATKGDQAGGYGEPREQGETGEQGKKAEAGGSASPAAT